MLAALIFPISRIISESGKATKCSSKLRSLGEAIFIYKAENDGYYPPNKATGGGGPETCWVAQIRPSFGIAKTDRDAGSIAAMAPNVTCPSVLETDVPKEWWDSNFAVNRMFGLDGTPKKIIVDNPAGIMMMIESKTKLRSVNNSPAPPTVVAYRHNARTKVLFFDGHQSLSKETDVPTNLDSGFWAAE